MEEVRQKTSGYLCFDCGKIIEMQNRLRITVRIPNKTFREDPKGEAGFTEKTVYKCPYCRGKLI